jgi:hypothetical protein
MQNTTRLASRCYGCSSRSFCKEYVTDLTTPLAQRMGIVKPNVLRPRSTTEMMLSSQSLKLPYVDNFPRHSALQVGLLDAPVCSCYPRRASNMDYRSHPTLTASLISQNPLSYNHAASSLDSQVIHKLWSLMSFFILWLDLASFVQ